MSTFITSIKENYFTTWTGLTCQLILQFLPKSISMTKGNLKQQFRNIQSTQPKPTISPNKNITLEIPQRTYSYQTGRLSWVSYIGHKYIMILYSPEDNEILSDPICSRAATDLVWDFEIMYTLLTKRGFHLTVHFLDNEAPSSLQQFGTIYFPKQY